MKKKLLPIALSLSMMVGLLPTMAFATEETEGGGGTAIEKEVEQEIETEPKKAVIEEVRAEPVSPDIGVMALATPRAVTTGICGVPDVNGGNDVTWSYDDGTKTLTIAGTGTGAMAHYDFTTSPWNAWKNNITEVIIQNGVSTIGNDAFRGCTGLTTVTIPSSVTSLDSNAFGGCTGLTSLTLPNGLTTIGNEAFRGCNGLTTVTIPNSVTSMGTSVFRECKNLTSVNLSNNLSSISESAFRDCEKLTSISIPNSVKTIDNFAFFGCTGLKSLSLGNGITMIGNDVFTDCNALTTVTIPNSVTSMGSSVFRRCTNLTSITIPSGVTSIGGEAFWDSSKLAHVYFKEDYHSSMNTNIFNGTHADLKIHVPTTATGWNPNPFTKGTVVEEDVYTLTVANGTPATDVAYENELVTITANPAPVGQPFVKWTTTDGVVLADETAETTTFTMPKKSVAITATYKPIPISTGSSPSIPSAKNTFTITATAGEGGSISPSGKVSVALGKSKEFTITPKEGYEIEEILVNGEKVDKEDTFAFENVKKGQSIHVTFAKLSEETTEPQEEATEPQEETANSFQDVSSADWFYTPVTTAVENRWFSGISQTMFAPNAPTTRSMLVTVLHRMEGSPLGQAPTFSDVSQGQWFTNGIGWSQEKTIVSGYENGAFGVNDNVTREQLVAIVYRYAKEIGIDVSQTTTLDHFTDAHTVAPYAKEPMAWAVAVGVISGKTKTTLAPTDLATRAEVSAILVRLDALK